MVCYLPRTSTLAVVGFAVYLIWHQVIIHFLGLAGTAAKIALLLGAAAAVAIALIWTARMIRRRRAQAGACTTCRFRCQQALQARPNLLVNRVDRRVTAPAPARPVARTCHPAAPLPGTRRPVSASRPVQAPRPAPTPRPVVPATERWPLVPRNVARNPVPSAAPSAETSPSTDTC